MGDVLPVAIQVVLERLSGIARPVIRFPAMKYLIGLFLCLSALSSHAKTKLSVTDSCDDQAGKMFVFNLREAVRSSSGYSLDQNQAINITVLCVDTAGSKDLEGYSSAISILVTEKFNSAQCGEQFGIIYHSVYVVGLNKAAAVAARALASIDHELSQ